MKGKILSFVLLALFVHLASGCTTARLEYDRMTGTAFPQPVTVGGEEVNLTTIYFQGNILLSVLEDDTDIAPLTGPFDPSDPNQYNFIRPDELDALILANRSSPVGMEQWPCGIMSRSTCTRYHVYGIVVDHFYENSSGVRQTSLLGLMYDSSLRSGFVNFYKNGTNSSDNGKFLRSTAHEIGHAVNLNHCDGDGSTTIMNQTGVVGDTYVYEFSASSLTHLQDHDRNVVWPGISTRHYDCPHVH